MSTINLSTHLDQALLKAEETLLNSDLVVLPTDTIYGIAALGSSPAALQKLLTVKNRSVDVPVAFLIADPKDIYELNVEVTEAAENLIADHWPGRLTLVLDKIAPNFKIGGREPGFGVETVGLRCPDHNWLRGLIRRTGPLAASSVNISGRSAAESISEIPAEIAAQVSVMIDGGMLKEKASSVIQVQGRHVKILRQGNTDFSSLSHL